MKKITLTLLLVMTMIVAATANCFAADFMLSENDEGAGTAIKVVGQVGPGGENPSSVLKDQLDGKTVVVTVAKKSFKVTAQMVADAVNEAFDTSFTGQDLSFNTKTKVGTYDFTVNIDPETSANMKVTIERNTSGTAVFEGNTIVIAVVALIAIGVVIALIASKRKKTAK